jgi:CheY-like chemotaxis protein
MLLVDDEPAIVRGLTRRLEQLGYDVRSAGTGEGAIQLARQGPVDIVVMDLHLGGGMTGIEAARQLWALHHAPVVFLTGDENAVINPALRFRVLLKPVRAHELDEALKQLLRD